MTIEGSRENRRAGEYVIDVTEYSHPDQQRPAVDYFQLKHSTVRTRLSMGFGELRQTLRGFANRYTAILKAGSEFGSRISFSVVTNRTISKRVKRALSDIGIGAKRPGMLGQIEKLTQLRGGALKDFCAALRLVDDEGDYVVQKEKLQSEVADYIAGFVDTDEIDKLVALVQDRALPKQSGEIYREDVLSRLGASSERDLFPAPATLRGTSQSSSP